MKGMKVVVAALMLFAAISGCRSTPPQGTWRGEIEGCRQGCPHEVLISLGVAKEGVVSGRAEYPSKNCQTEFVFVETQENGGFLYRERSHSQSQCKHDAKVTIKRVDSGHITAQWKLETRIETLEIGGEAYGRLAPFNPPPPLHRNEAKELLAEDLNSFLIECFGGYWFYRFNSERWEEHGVGTRYPGSPERTFWIPLGHRLYEDAHKCVQNIQRTGYADRSDVIKISEGGFYGRTTAFLWNSHDDRVRLYNRGEESSYATTWHIQVTPCGSVKLDRVSPQLTTWIRTATADFQWHIEVGAQAKKLSDCQVLPRWNIANLQWDSEKIPMNGTNSASFVFEEGGWILSRLQEENPFSKMKRGTGEYAHATDRSSSYFQR